MSTTTPQARDFCMGLIAAAIASPYPALDVRWPGKPEAAPPVATAKFMRVSMIHADGAQASLACHNGKRRYRREGVIIVACFVPIDAGSLPAAEAMACVVRDAFQGDIDGDVWFRNATTREVGPDASWYQVNAQVEFQYDEVR